MIKTSQLSIGNAQIDGRHYVSEIHTFDDGKVVCVEYLSLDDGNEQKRMDERVSFLEEQRVQEELQEKERDDLNRATLKRDTYLSSLTEPMLKTALDLTDDELLALKKQHG